MGDPWWETLLQAVVQRSKFLLCCIFSLLHVPSKVTMLVCLKEAEGKKTW